MTHLPTSVTSTGTMASPSVLLVVLPLVIYFTTIAYSLIELIMAQVPLRRERLVLLHAASSMPSLSKRIARPRDNTALCTPSSAITHTLQQARSLTTALPARHHTAFVTALQTTTRPVRRILSDAATPVHVTSTRTVPTTQKSDYVRGSDAVGANLCWPFSVSPVTTHLIAARTLTARAVILA